jgi:trimeric autotransporter adhesin
VASRYWVGGSSTWDATAGTKWALTDGGAGGQAVPTSADDVYFTATSGANTVTVAATTNCKNLTFTGFTGTFAGTSPINIYGDLTVASGMTWTYSNTLLFSGATTQTITSNGKALAANLTVSIANTTVSLADALSTSGSVTITNGTFTTNNYAVTSTSLSSSNSNTRTINLGSSTVTLTLTSPIVMSTTTNLTLNAGTSTIIINSAGGIFAGSGLTWYNLSFTSSSASGTMSVTGSNTFNNLTVAGLTTAGCRPISFAANQTINGTLTLSAGTNATMRTFVQSDTIGTTRTLTCAAIASLTDIDFRDITIAGAAAPVSGTRLGDCKGNSGITFDAAKTVYWNQAGGGNWSTISWATTGGGTPAVTNFPLAQDTAIIQSTGLNSGNFITISANWNIGTIDMSARTSNTMTLATGTTTPTIYGNWINGTGTTLSGSGIVTFAGRSSQTITSAGRTFTQSLSIDVRNGSVTLQDAFVSNRNSVGAIALSSGTLDANGYNVTLSGSIAGLALSGTSLRTLAIGSGTWTLGGTGTFDASTSTNLTVTGTGTISLTSASAKTFAGGGIQTYPTLNQGGTGALTITGSNGFRSMTNTAIGSVLFTGGTTNTFSVSFSLNGALANLLTLGSTNTTQAIVKKPTSWQMGLTSVDAGNNTGLTFLSSDGTMSYLSVSYINGQLSAVPYTGNFFAFF